MKIMKFKIDGALILVYSVAFMEIISKDHIVGALLLILAQLMIITEKLGDKNGTTD